VPNADSVENVCRKAWEDPCNVYGRRLALGKCVIKVTMLCDVQSRIAVLLPTGTGVAL